MTRMDTYDTTQAHRFEKTLLDRVLLLREQLGHDTDAMHEGVAWAEDFKEVAANDAMAGIEDVQSAHAAAELSRVRAALRRIADGTYGTCLDCGYPIDLRRLGALPTAAYCTDCEEARERPGGKA
jgi:DnaK suppressor protein